MIDVKQATLDPTSVFKEPTDVGADETMSRDQKIEILHRWEYDARELEVAEEEAGMAILRPDMVAVDQTPQYSDVRGAGHDGGDFIFVRKK